MTRQRYPETFKIEAVKQVTERGRPVADVARALGVSSHSLYAWLKQYGKPADQQHEESALQAEIRRLKAELRQVTEERNILKEAAAYFASESRKGTRSYPPDSTGTVSLPCARPWGFTEVASTRG